MTIVSPKSCDPRVVGELISSIFIFINQSYNEQEALEFIGMGTWALFMMPWCLLKTIVPVPPLHKRHEDYEAYFILFGT